MTIPCVGTKMQVVYRIPRIPQAIRDLDELGPVDRDRLCDDVCALGQPAFLAKAPVGSRARFCLHGSWYARPERIQA